MKKNEAYNDVPLKQFIEFFMKSQVSMPIGQFDFFLAACKNVCLIDLADNTETLEGQTQQQKAQKIPTIKLKSGILRDLILDSRNDSSRGPSQNWQVEHKKKISDFQFQNDAIHQLMDIFISQIKGPKMDILKCLKANKLECENDFKLEIKDN
jgi:hypothetical protein